MRARERNLKGREEYRLFVRNGNSVITLSESTIDKHRGSYRDGTRKALCVLMAHEIIDETDDNISDVTIGNHNTGSVRLSMGACSGRLLTGLATR